MVQAKHPLWSSLFANYSAGMKPRYNNSEPVNVEVKLIMSQILIIDELLQTFSFTGWFYVTWTDDFLQLPISRDIEQIRVPNEKVWKPDLSLYNSLDDPQKLTDGNEIVLYKSGKAIWYPGGSYTTSCPINIRRYPFDEQSCQIRLGAWMLDIWMQNISIYKDGLQIRQAMYDDGIWEFTGHRIEYKLLATYATPYLIYHIHLKRRLLFPLLNFVLPVMLLSLLNAVVFIMPVKSGEKMTLCISLLISFTVFLTLLSESLPHTSINTPLVSIYLGVQLMVSVFSIIATTVIIRREINRTGVEREITRTGGVREINRTDVEREIDHSGGEHEEKNIDLRFYTVTNNTNVNVETILDTNIVNKNSKSYLPKFYKFVNYTKMIFCACADITIDWLCFIFVIAVNVISTVVLFAALTSEPDDKL